MSSSAKVAGGVAVIAAIFAAAIGVLQVREGWYPVQSGSGGDEAMYITSGDALRRTRAVFVPADRLRPQAKAALRGTAAPGVVRDVRVPQVADVVALDVEVALVNVHHARQLIHRSDEFALGVVDDFSVAAKTQAGDFFQR